MMRRRGNNLMSASVAGILTADARSDEEVRSKIHRTFGSVLALLFLLDIGCALAVLWVPCAQDEHDDHFSLVACVRKSIVHGFTFHPLKSKDDHDLGDLFLLSILRCVMTSALLFCGARFGTRGHSAAICPPARPTPPSEQDATATTNNGDSSDLSAPLLRNEEESRPEGEDNPVAERSGFFQKLEPSRVKNIVLVALFISSTLFQVYAGLKVSTFDHSNGILTPLLCLTVLWINAQAYVFRTLLSEMTREKGLFLPPEVHRHPMHLVRGSGLAAYQFCDLCHQRITREGDDNTQSRACYRCALCDFEYVFNAYIRIQGGIVC